MAKHSLCALVISAILVAGCSDAASTPGPAGATLSPATQGPASTAIGATPVPSGLPVLETRMEGPTVIDVPADVVSTSVVTPAGAVIQADGVSVTVPAGGVASATTVVVTRLNAPFYMNIFARYDPTDVAAIPIGHAYDFGPAGLQFAQPVEVTLPYDPQYVPAGTDPARIAAAYFNGVRWVVAGGTADPVAHTVTVRLRAFEGIVWVSALVATVIGLAVNAGIHWYSGGEGIKTDKISKKEAPKWITPDDPTVKDAAAKATVGGVPLGDEEALAEYLKKNAGKNPPVTLIGADGTPRTLQNRAAKGPDGKWLPTAGWQEPADFLTKFDMRGDCTDVTNTLVSMFRALGYPAKAAFGYVVDETGAHVWGEVLIGGEVYFIDDDGQLQPLDEAIAAAQIFRPERGDPRDFMWDENGQDPYPHPPELAWWMQLGQALTLTYAEGAGTTWNFAQTFAGVRIDGTPKADGTVALTSSVHDVPLAFGANTTGTGDFTFDGIYDPATGKIKGTFTYFNAMTVADKKASLYNTITYPGDASGKIVGDKAIVTLMGYMDYTSSLTSNGVTTNYPGARVSTIFQLTFTVQP